MDYDESLRWLQTLPDFERTGQFSSRPDVAPVLALLEALGNPHLGRPTLHIAGSKGKGSTAAIAESILRAAGRHTGFYLSPHLHRFVERVRVDGAPTAPETFARAMTAVREAMPAITKQFPGRELVAFDALTAAAFVVFAEAEVEAQVIEVGLGGLLDSTNVFQEAHDPQVSAITSISLEHTAVLGSTIAEIAAQKAGIIVPGDVVVTAPMRESALDVVRERAAAQGAKVIEVPAVCQIARTSASASSKPPRSASASHATTAVAALSSWWRPASGRCAA